MAINHNKVLSGQGLSIMNLLTLNSSNERREYLKIDVGEHKISLFSHLARLTDLLSHI